MSPTTTRPPAHLVWLKAARLRTLPAALAPVAMGTTLAWSEGGFHALAALAALAGAVLIQVGTNFANDYFDHQKGADTEDRLGETRATQAGWVSPARMRRAFVLTFAASVVVAGYLVVRGGWPLAAVGALSILFGILYTGGPRPLGYLGLGDPLVLVFFGPVAVAGTHYVQTLSYSWKAAAVGLVPGLLSTAILVVNNLRDRGTDAAAGKRTLVVRFGPAVARAEYALCVVSAGATLVGLVVVGWAPRGALWPLAAAPFGAWLVREVYRHRGAALDPLLARTGQLLVVTGLLFCLGWLL